MANLRAVRSSTNDPQVTHRWPLELQPTHRWHSHGTAWHSTTPPFPFDLTRQPEALVPHVDCGVVGAAGDTAGPEVVQVATLHAPNGYGGPTSLGKLPKPRDCGHLRLLETINPSGLLDTQVAGARV